MAPDDPPVVVDTNIIFSALLGAESPFREVLFTSPRRFVICETTIVDLFRLKEKLRALRPGIPDDVLSQMLHAILRRVELMRESSFSNESWNAAVELCRDVDPDDAPQVALALAVDGVLWTGDGRLKRALQKQGFVRFFTPSETERP